MKKLLPLLLIIVIFFLFSFSCRKLVQKGELSKIDIKDLKSIPLEYGRLVSVTAHASYNGWAQLWFEDDQHTIRMVRIQFHEDKVHPKTLVIPRK